MRDLQKTLDRLTYFPKEFEMAERIILEWDADNASDSYILFMDDQVYAENIKDPTYTVQLSDIGAGQHTFSVAGVNSFGQGERSDILTINFTLPGKIQNLRYTLV